MATRVRFRRGTAAEWTTANPILALAEIGYELPAVSGNVGKTKVGDGTRTWTNLPYATSGLISDTAELSAQIAALIAADASIQSASVKALPLFTATASVTTYSKPTLAGKTLEMVFVNGAGLASNQFSQSGNNLIFANLSEAFDGTEEIKVFYTG